MGIVTTSRYPNSHWRQSTGGLLCSLHGSPMRGRWALQMSQMRGDAGSRECPSFEVQAVRMRGDTNSPCAGVRWQLDEPPRHCRRSTGAGHSVHSRRWNMPRSNGWTGSTTGDCWSRSAISLRRKQKRNITPCWTTHPWQHSSNQMVSGNAGAVHGCGVIKV